MYAIRDIVIRTQQITHLDISKNRIGDKGAKIISEILGDNRCLVHLNVSSIQVGYKGANYLFQKLVACHLKYLIFF